jgi:hypothetical protein
LVKAACVLSTQNVSFIEALNKVRNDLLHVRASGHFRDHPALADDLECLKVYGPATHARWALLDYLGYAPAEKPN